MYIIGLTGGMGAGKGYCSKIFEKHKILSLDTDRVSREVCAAGSACLSELADRFGRQILNSDGSLDRKALADIAFQSEKNTADLNAITHKYIIAECLSWLDSRRDAGDFAAIIDAPLLYESGLDKMCDFVVAVIADTELRIKRAIARDGITREQALARIKKQKDNEFFISNADFSISNNDTDDVISQIDTVIETIVSKQKL
jgi:dephospho-CoA kinase